MTTRLLEARRLPFQHHDERGSIYQPWNAAWPTRDIEWKQENVLVERFGALRGLHCHEKAWLLMTCLWGHVIVGLLDPETRETKQFDFLVDADKPETYQLLVPPGIAVGHCSLSDGAVFHYLWSSLYNEEKQTTFKWNAYGIEWRIDEPILSDRDQNGPFDR